MIQVICPECKGKGKVPCPICVGNNKESKNTVDCTDNKESQEKENSDNGENNKDNKNIVDCRDNKESQEKKCSECGGTGEVLCTACMGGGIMDTNAFA